MTPHEARDVIGDIKLSCYNHMRGTPDCHGVEYNRFKMRAEALSFALSVIERAGNIRRIADQIVEDDSIDFGKQATAISKWILGE